MTLQEAKDKYLNKKVAIVISKKALTVYAMVVEVEEMFGELRYRVEPLEGEGTIWVKSVQLI